MLETALCPDRARASGSQPSLFSLRQDKAGTRPPHAPTGSWQKWSLCSPDVLWLAIFLFTHCLFIECALSSLATLCHLGNEAKMDDYVGKAGGGRGGQRMGTASHEARGGCDHGFLPFRVRWMEPPCMHRCPEQAEPTLTEHVPDCTAGCYPWNKTPPLYCRFAPLSLHHNHPRAVMKPTTALAGPSNSDLMTKFRFAGSHSWYAIAKLKKVNPS